MASIDQTQKSIIQSCFRSAIGCTVVLLALLGAVKAQDAQPLNVDSLFGEARKLAFDNQREVARTLCYTLLETAPLYYDIRILAGRTLAWDHYYDSARTTLKTVLAQAPTYKDALYALADVEQWSGNYSAAMAVCDRGLAIYPKDKKLLLDKSKALVGVCAYKRAAALLDSLLQYYPEDSTVRVPQQALEQSYLHLNQVRADGLYDFYKDVSVNVSSISYTRENACKGTFIGRLNLGNRTDNRFAERIVANGLQAELEAYIPIPKNKLIYLTYAYSSSVIFPEQKAGLEYYYHLNTLELSLGARYMQFVPESAPPVDVYVFTGSVGAYLSAYWFSLRPYWATHVGQKLSQAYILSLRRYWASKDDYLTLSLGYGNSPDERANQYVDYVNLYSKNVRVDFRHRLTKHLVVLGGISYKREEFRDWQFRELQTKQRNHYEINVGVIALLGVL